MNDSRTNKHKHHHGTKLPAQHATTANVAQPPLSPLRHGLTQQAERTLNGTPTAATTQVPNQRLPLRGTAKSERSQASTPHSTHATTTTTPTPRTAHVSASENVVRTVVLLVDERARRVRRQRDVPTKGCHVGGQGLIPPTARTARATRPLLENVVKWLSVLRCGDNSAGSGSQSSRRPKRQQ